MSLDRAEGLPVEQRAEPAANEEFVATVIASEPPKPQAGWDPYEVWRMRVRLPSLAARASEERDRRR